MAELKPLALELLGRQTASWAANALGMNKLRLVADACEHHGGTYDPRTDRVALPPEPEVTPADQAVKLLQPYLDHPSKQIQRATRRLLHDLERLGQFLTDAAEREAIRQPLSAATARLPGITNPHAVRAWARQAGHSVGDRGRISHELQRAYLEATGGPA